MFFPRMYQPGALVLPLADFAAGALKDPFLREALSQEGPAWRKQVLTSLQ